VAKREIVFTGAHQTMGLKRYKRTMSELYKNDGAKLSDIAQQLVQYCRDPDSSRTRLQDCCETIKTEIDNVGAFFAWQVTADLLEAHCLRPCHENEWTLLGMGANSEFHRELLFVFAPLNRSRRIIL
jgi:hypothetical protein